MRYFMRGLGLFIISASALVNAQEVIPDFYKEPGIQPNRDFVNQSHNENIDPFTGSLQRHYVDLRIPGNGGLDLKIIRSYNSSNVDPGNAGQPRTTAGWGWSIHFGRILRAREKLPCVNMNSQTIADNPILELPDGSRQLLAFTGQTSPKALTTQRWKAECYLGDNGNGLVVTSPDGIIYEMTQALGYGSSASPVYEWHTKKITDRNGNFIAINYVAEASPEIRNITTSDGRSVSFSYYDSGTISARIRSITGAGKTFQYSYQPSGISGIYQLSNVTRPDGSTWAYGYDGNNGSSAGSYLMRSAKSPYGGTINYSYAFVYFDSQSNPGSRSNVVSSKSLSTGGSWSFNYQPGGPGSLDTTTVTSPAGTTTYKHIGPKYVGPGTVWKVGLLVEKRIGNTQVEQYTWQGQQISSETYVRPGAFVTKFDYLQTNAPLLTQKLITRDGATYRTDFSNFDSYGNAQSIIESGPNGGSKSTTRSYYVNTTKWIINQVQNESSSGESISRSFDSNGNLSNETKNGISISRQYDSDGNVSSVTFPRSLTHRYSSYMRGVPQTENQPEGVSIYRQVNDAGNVTSETDGSGRTNRYGYDDLNRITSVDPPAGNRVTVTYGTNIRTASRGGLTETTNYDDFGRVTSVNRGGIVTSFSVDPLGRTTFESSPNGGSGKNYSYDILNRLVQVTNPDGSSRTITYGGASKTIRNERGYSTTYSYRAYGDPDKVFLMGISTPDSASSVSYVRNNKDLITSAAQGGVSRSFTYNTAGYMVSATHPELGVVSYERDAAGNMTSKNVSGTGAIAYSYDSLNRLSTVNYYGAAPSATHSYDGAHRLLSTTTSDAARRFTYDSNGNIRTEELATADISWSAQYGYNGNDQLTSIVYPRSGETVYYGVNNLGQPTSITGYVTSASYWPSGQIQRIAYANGTSSEYGQNSRLWPSSFFTSKSGSYYNQSSFGYDTVGNLTSISDSTAPVYGRTFGYDEMDRLTNFSTPQGSGSVSYNGAGNITNYNAPGLLLSYVYDGNNRLNSVYSTPNTFTATYSYDGLGNIASGGGRTYSYDSVPNLKCVNCATPATSVQYTYDGDQKRTRVSQGNTKTHEFHSVHGNLLAEYTPGSPGKLIQYIYLNGKRIAQKESAQ